MLILAGAAGPADAQSTSLLRSAQATRAEIEAQVAQLERLAVAEGMDREDRRRQRYEAALLRTRLDSGDFRPGDRIVLTLRADSTGSDTLVVRGGSVVLVDRLPEISLRGVLRSELEAHLAEQIGRYIRDPEIRATPLVRLAVLGEVRAPGFYSVPADILLSDVVMLAGGPTPLANLEKVTVQRGGQELWDAAEIEVAFQQGFTLDQMSLQAGDAFTVAARPQRSVQTFFAIIGGITGLTYTILALLNN